MRLRIEGARALVTGGAGFVGSHLTEELLARGAEVVIVDNLSTGRPENIPPGTARFYQTDIRDKVKLSEVFRTFRPQVAFHEAAQISVSRSVREPVFDAKSNIIGLLNVLALSVEIGVSKVVFASSGGTLYGEVDRPVGEDAPLKPKSPYGIAKLAGERYLDFFYHEYGLPYVSLRYGNVYGPRQDPHGEAGVVAIFTNLLLASRRPTINGDGRYIRDYVYVSDVVRANIMAAESEVDSGAYNIGTSIGTDVNEIYGGIGRVLGSTVEPHYGPPRPGDLRKSLLLIDKAAESFQWQPQIALHEGLKLTTEWFAESRIRGLQESSGSLMRKV